MAEAKPFDIPKQLVWEAYKRVKANRGAAGVDGQSLADFEKDLKGNLYKVWNRMSSGSYFPPPVRLVEIPKGGGACAHWAYRRWLIALRRRWSRWCSSPSWSRISIEDSYGYRPGKSALDAVGTARKRCWRADWVIDLDIKGFFDNLDHDLVLQGRRPPHGQPVGPSVHRAVAECPRGDAGWDAGGADDGHSARWCHQPAAGQSLHALRVRRLDAAELSRRSSSSDMRTMRSSTA